MTMELRLLAWTLVLALAQLMAAAAAKRGQDGMAWAAGPRDTPPPAYSGLAGRLNRAHANFMETLPLFAAAIVVAHLAGREGALTLWGAWIYAPARLAFALLYAIGAGGLRSAAWAVSFFGLVLVLAAIVA